MLRPLPSLAYTPPLASSGSLCQQMFPPRSDGHLRKQNKHFRRSQLIHHPAERSEKRILEADHRGPSQLRLLPTVSQEALSSRPSGSTTIRRRQLSEVPEPHLSTDGKSWRTGPERRAWLTDGIDLIHKDDAGLVVTGVVEHLSDEPSALADVLIHDGAGHHLQASAAR